MGVGLESGCQLSHVPTLRAGSARQHSAGTVVVRTQPPHPVERNRAHHQQRLFACASLSTHEYAGIVLPPHFALSRDRRSGFYTMQSEAKSRV